MAKYNADSVIQAKQLLSSRLAYILRDKLRYTTRKALASRIGMSPQMVGRVANAQYRHISLDAMLIMAESLNCRYKLVMEYDGKRRPTVSVILEDLYANKPQPKTTLMG